MGRSPGQRRLPRSSRSRATFVGSPRRVFRHHRVLGEREHFRADLTDGDDVTGPQINIVENWFQELRERVPVD